MGLGEWISDGFDYLSAVWGYWIAAMVWVAFIMGDLANWGGFRGWLDRKLPIGRRRPVELAIMVALVFIGGFMAWRDEKAKFDRSERQRNGSVYWLGVWSSRASERWHAIHDHGGYLDQIETWEGRAREAEQKPPRIIKISPPVLSEPPANTPILRATALSLSNDHFTSPLLVTIDRIRMNYPIACIIESARFTNGTPIAAYQNSKDINDQGPLTYNRYISTNITVNPMNPAFAGSGEDATAIPQMVVQFWIRPRDAVAFFRSTPVVILSAKTLYGESFEYRLTVQLQNGPLQKLVH